MEKRESFNFKEKTAFNPKEKEIEKQIRKIKKVIEMGGDKLTREADFHFKKAMEELQKEMIEIEQDELLLKALELLKKDWGFLPDNLSEKFIELKEGDVAKKIVQELTAGDEGDLYPLLGKYVIEAKKEGLELDGKNIEKRIRGLLAKADK